MRDHWSYDRAKRIGNDGTRWHFVSRNAFGLPYEEQPVEYYFRNDERTVFGVLRFAHRKDNPYRDYKTVINKIMNNAEFRESLLDSDTKDIWHRNWK